MNTQPFKPLSLLLILVPLLISCVNTSTIVEEDPEKKIVVTCSMNYEGEFIHEYGNLPINTLGTGSISFTIDPYFDWDSHMNNRGRYVASTLVSKIVLNVGAESASSELEQLVVQLNDGGPPPVDLISLSPINASGMIGGIPQRDGALRIKLIHPTVGYLSDIDLPLSLNVWAGFPKKLMSLSVRAPGNGYLRLFQIEELSEFDCDSSVVPM